MKGRYYILILIIIGAIIGYFWGSGVPACPISELNQEVCNPSQGFYQLIGAVISGIIGGLIGYLLSYLTKSKF